MQKKNPVTSTPSSDQPSPETTTVKAPVEITPQSFTNQESPYQDQNTVSQQPSLLVNEESGSPSSPSPKVNQKYINGAVRNTITKSKFSNNPEFVDKIFKNLESYYSPEQIEKAKKANADIIPQVEPENNPEYAKEQQDVNNPDFNPETGKIERSTATKVLEAPGNIVYNTLANSSQSIADGLDQVFKATKDIIHVPDVSGEPPKDATTQLKDFGTDALNIGSGVAKGGFGVLGLVSPELAGFNLAVEATNQLPTTVKAAIASSIIPDSQSRTDEDLADSFDKTMSFPFSAASAIATKIGYKPEDGSAGKAALEILNILIPLGIHKGATEYNKLGESINSLKDMSDIAQGISEGTATPEQIKAYGVVSKNIEDTPIGEVKDLMEQKAKSDKVKNYIAVPNAEIIEAHKTETPVSLREKANDSYKQAEGLAEQRDQEIASSKVINGEATNDAGTEDEIMVKYSPQIQGLLDQSEQHNAMADALEHHDEAGENAPKLIREANESDMPDEVKQQYTEKINDSALKNEGLQQVENAKATHKQDMKSLSDPRSGEAYDLAEELYKDPKVMDRVKASLDSSVNTKEITQEEADLQLKGFKDVFGIVENINPKIADHADKYEVVKLALELKEKQEDLKKVKLQFPPEKNLNVIIENKERGIENTQKKAAELLEKAKEKTKADADTKRLAELQGKENLTDEEKVELDALSPKTTGIAARLHPEHESGGGLSPEEHVARGKELIKEDEYSQEKIRKRLNTNKGFASSEDLDAARAHYTELVKKANALEGDEKAFLEAKDKAAEWLKNVVEPMGNIASDIFRGFQKEEDLDTGSLIGLESAYTKRTGKTFNPEQAKEAKALVEKIKELNLKYEDLEKKYTEAMNKWAAEERNTPKEKIARNPSLSSEKAKRKAELKKELMGRFNDVTSMATLLADKKFYEYSGLLFEEAAGDFKYFAKDISTSFSKILKEDIPELWRKLGGSEDAIKQHEADIEKLSTQFIDKKDNKFNPDQVKDIWNHAKDEYLDQGKSYQEMVRGVSMDLGLTSEQVQHALASPKGARPINDQMYLTQRARRQAINNAKYFVENAEIPKWKRFVPFSKTSIWSNFFFQKSVFGHTGVGMQTHAGMNIFDPTQSANYFKSYVQQFKNLNKVEYEKSMENMANDPQYVQFLRAGLDIDPNKGYSEYEQKSLGKIGGFFKEIGESGNRGFGALKTFRFNVAKDYYNSLSEVERADPETIKKISELVNNGTGVAKIQPNKIISTLVFAPKLIASRWNRLIIQPVKAIGILSDWSNATPSEKAAVKVTARRAGTELATMGALLALNQGLLIASGSDKRVNIDDPTKPDWMRFRWGNTALDLSGGMVGTAQFVARILHDIAPWTTQQDLKGKTRKEAIMIALGNYAFNTVSPVTSTIGEPVLRHDFNGNTVPWSDEKPLYKTSHKLTWKEYLWQQAPIPAAEAAKDMYDSMYESGMDEPSIGEVLTGIMRGVIAGGTGARVMELKEKPKVDEQ